MSSDINAPSFPPLSSTSSPPLEWQERLKELYRSAEHGGISVSKFLETSWVTGVLKHFKVSKAIAKVWLNDFKETQLIRAQNRIVHKAKYFPITARNGPFSKLVVDLMDLRDYRGAGGNYLFIMIDVFTRYVLDFVVKSKSEKDIKEAFMACFKQIKAVNGFLPDSFELQGDKESAWDKSKSIKSMLKQLDVETNWSSHDYGTTSIVDQFVRTIRQLMGDTKRQHPQLSWKTIIPLVTHKYNEVLRHTRLYSTPFQAIDNAGSRQWFYHVNDIQRRVQRAELTHKKLGYPSEYKHGDKVHVELVQHKTFREKGGRKFNPATYTIDKRTGNGKYSLEEVPGKIYKFTELIPSLESRPSIYPEKERKSQINPPSRKRKQREEEELPLTVTQQSRGKRVSKPTQYSYPILTNLSNKRYKL